MLFPQCSYHKHCTCKSSSQLNMCHFFSLNNIVCHYLTEIHNGLIEYSKSPRGLEFWEAYTVELERQLRGKRPGHSCGPRDPYYQGRTCSVRPMWWLVL